MDRTPHREDTSSWSIAIGGDHGGFRLKRQLKEYIENELGFTTVDCGSFSPEAVDYPDIAVEVAVRVATGTCRRGILIDGAGIGSCMAANKIDGILAAVAHDDRSVQSSRIHNNSNILCLGASLVPPGHARRLVRLWLTTPFAGGRHEKRVDKIRALERRTGKGNSFR